MSNERVTVREERESLFLNEYVMAALSAFVVAASLVSLVFFRTKGDSLSCSCL